MAKMSQIIGIKAVVSTIQMTPKSNLALLKKIMLIYGSLDTGGIETLIIRIANFFSSSGVHVTVCFNTGGELKSSLDSRVNIIKYSETKDLIRYVREYHQTSPAIGEVLVISFDPISAARALIVEMAILGSIRVVHITGVFHPHAYFMPGERKDRIFLNYLIAQAIGNDKIFFMNEECRSAHGAKWATDLSVSRLLALPVNHVDARWHSSKKAVLRIVSVGRLVGFKAYNMGAAKIVKACLDHGVEVTWDIYGYGIQSNAIQAEIDLMGVKGYVRLMGKLDYSNLESTLVSYDLFVGMGTSALEAAMIGLPTICATINEAAHCYGYLYELPFGNVGELQSAPPDVEMTELIQRYSTLDQDERLYLSSQCRMAAANYGLPKFADALAQMAANKKNKSSNIKKRVIAGVYKLATESYLVKFFRRSIAKNVRLL